MLMHIFIEHNLSLSYSKTKAFQILLNNTWFNSTCYQSLLRYVWFYKYKMRELINCPVPVLRQSILNPAN